jgi:hypothetical protein
MIRRRDFGAWLTIISCPLGWEVRIRMGRLWPWRRW